MSLINKMLRDLDARRAPAADRTQMQQAVHAAQMRPGHMAPRLALVIVSIAAVAAGSWYWLAGKNQLPVQAVPALQPAPAPQPQVASPSPVVPAPVANARPEAPSQPKTAALSRGPAASSGIAQPPVATPNGANASPRNRDATKGRPLATPRSQGTASTSPTASSTGAKESAATVAESSIEKRPHTPLANEAAENEYNKAITVLRRGATAEAIAGLQLTLRLDALHVSARQALLSLLMRQQRWGEAQALAEEGLAADPTQTGWAIALARMQMEGGKLPEATETLTRHARYADRNADYHAFQALLLQKQKRYKEASDRYIAAVALRPGEARWWYGLGVSLQADQRPQEAREAFLKANQAGNLPPELASSLKHHLH